MGEIIDGAAHLEGRLGFSTKRDPNAPPPPPYVPTPYVPPHGPPRPKPTPRLYAARESMRAFQAATEERRRAAILAYPSGSLADAVNVTEDVVSIMDRLTTTLDWGSGFFDDDDLAAFIRLADLLKIDLPEGLR